HASSFHSGNRAVHERTRSPTILARRSAFRWASTWALCAVLIHRFSVSNPKTSTRNAKIDSNILVRSDIAHLSVPGPESPAPGPHTFRKIGGYSGVGGRPIPSPDLLLSPYLLKKE